MYSLSAYGQMIADPRTEAYVLALRQWVRPHSVVLDIGTGMGFFALLACRFGARKVYAVEPDDAIEVGRQAASANGYQGRIEFHQRLSTQITLKPRADIIVSDLRGVLPLFGHHLPAIVDARQRHLAPGGRLVPLQDTLWIAVVQAPDLYRQHTVPWENHSRGLDLEAARPLLTNSWYQVQAEPGQLLVEPRLWATLDYATLDSANADGEAVWTVPGDGLGHGLLIWFDALLTQGVHFSNAPGKPKLLYGTGFFPWSRPVSLAAGDEVAVRVQARLIGEDYVWLWDTEVKDGNRREGKASFHQSTLYGPPLSRSRLRKRAASHLPTLNEDGKVDGRILELMDQGASLGDIARQVAVEFPARFAQWESALTRVGDLSVRYSADEPAPAEKGQGANHASGGP